MSTFPRFSTRRRVANRLVIAMIAGAVIAVSIGLGAHNAIWVAILGAMGIVAGLAITPRPSRLTEMPQWELAGSSPGTPVRVESVTRSVINATSVQPTSVTATVTPLGDTSYRTTWITAMNKSYADALLKSGTAKLIPASVPARPVGGRRAKTPEFGDYPGPWAVIYPGVTLAVCAALLFGVPASVWHVDVSLPSITSSSTGGGMTQTEGESLSKRLNAIVQEISSIQPTAARTALRISFGTSGSDNASFYDPDTGQEISLYRSSDGGFSPPTRRDSSSRGDDAFDLTPFTHTDLDRVTVTMADNLAKAATPMDLESVTINQPYDMTAPVLTGEFRSSTNLSRSAKVEALGDGTVAEYFDPADFTTSFRLARSALVARRVPLTTKIFERFEIRGSAPATPSMFAGPLTAGNGIGMVYSTATKNGTLTIAPGQFPRIHEYAITRGRLPENGFAFNQLSPAVFESVRSQAMARGGVKQFDRGAIDIEAVDDGHWDVPAPFIRVRMSKIDAASGRYSMTGEFMVADYS